AAGWRRDLLREKNSRCGLNAFSRAFKSCISVQAGLLALRRSISGDFTVARPRGILTRFPILLIIEAPETLLKELWNRCSSVMSAPYHENHWRSKLLRRHLFQLLPVAQASSKMPSESNFSAKEDDQDCRMDQRRCAHARSASAAYRR